MEKAVCWPLAHVEKACIIQQGCCVRRSTSVEQELSGSVSHTDCPYRHGPFVAWMSYSHALLAWNHLEVFIHFWGRIQLKLQQANWQHQLI